MRAPDSLPATRPLWTTTEHLADLQPGSRFAVWLSGKHAEGRRRRAPTSDWRSRRRIERL